MNSRLEAMNSESRPTLKVLVRNNRAKCPSCGLKVKFLLDQPKLVTHKTRKGEQWCQPSYEGIEFVFPYGHPLEDSKMHAERKAKGNKFKSRSSQPQNEQEKSNRQSRQSAKSAEARREARQTQRHADRYAMIDPHETASLQDHDVEDTGRSIRGRSGGLPGTNRRRR